MNINIVLIMLPFEYNIWICLWNSKITYIVKFIKANVLKNIVTSLLSNVLYYLNNKPNLTHLRRHTCKPCCSYFVFLWTACDT